MNHTLRCLALLTLLLGCTQSHSMYSAAQLPGETAEEKGVAMAEVVRIKPQSISLRNQSVTAQVRLDQAKDSWEVVVVLSRPAGLEPIPAEAVGAKLIEANDAPMRLIEQPAGFLVEYGSDLGTSVNARYRFAKGAAAPSKLLVRYLEEWVSFRLKVD